jgi:hypothetical protein
VSSNLHSPFPFSSLFSSEYVKLLNIIIGCARFELCFLVGHVMQQTGLGFFFLKKKKTL